MATRLFSASKYGEQLFNQAGARRLSVATLGESHGQAFRLGKAIQYAVWRHYHADIVFDHRPYADGGRDFAVGGTTIAGPDGLTTQLGRFQTRPADIAFVASGYNDQISTAAEAAALSATVMGVADGLFAAGAKFVVVCGVSPGQDPAGTMAYNQLIRNYCAASQGAFFLDITGLLADPQNAGTLPFRNIASNPQGTFGSFTADGTHWSGHAIRLIAPSIAGILRKIAGERAPRAGFNAGNYDPANAPYTNMLGDAGMCMGDQGVLDGHDGGGNVAGTGAASRIWLSKNGTVDFTPSIATGADGERKQRIALSGTAASGAIELKIPPAIAGADGGVATRKLDFEASIELTGVTGLSDVILRPVNAANGSIAFQQSAQACNRWPDGTTETLFARTLYPVDVPAGDNPEFEILFMFGSGSDPAGTIDVSRMSAAVVEE